MGAFDGRRRRRPSRSPDLATLASIVGETAGVPTAEAFAASLLESFARALPEATVSLTHRVDGEPRFAIHGLTEQEAAEKYPDGRREHVFWLENLHGVRVGVATEDLPPAVIEEWSTFRVLWRDFELREALGAFARRRGRPPALLTVAFGRRHRREVDRWRRLLERLLPYVNRSLDHYAHLGRLGARLGRVEEVARAAAPALVVDGRGRVSWMSDAARSLFVSLTGRPDAPAELRAYAARVLGALARSPAELLGPLGESERLVVSGRTFDVRLKPIETEGGGRAALVTAEDLTDRVRGVVDERLRALALPAREREVVALVIGGLSNKQIAGRLGIGTQTVKNHLRSIFARAGVQRRTELFRTLLADLLD